MFAVPQCLYCRLPQQQRQQQYLGQPTGPLSNATLSQDLLRQLQLGQTRMQAPTPQTYPQLGHTGLHAYQHAAPAYAQPRSGGVHAHEQSHLQVSVA